MAILINEFSTKTDSYGFPRRFFSYGFGLCDLFLLGLAIKIHLKGCHHIGTDLVFNINTQRNVTEKL